MQITANQLKAALLFAASKDVRYYLNGVCFESASDGSVLLVATDGHQMLVQGIGRSTIKLGPRLLRSLDLKALLADKKTSYDFEFQADAVAVNGRSYPYSQGTARSSGHFPDWRRVVPRPDAPAEGACFDANHLLNVQKAAKLLVGSEHNYKITPHGSTAARVDFATGCPAGGGYQLHPALAVIMPKKEIQLSSSWSIPD